MGHLRRTRTHHSKIARLPRRAQLTARSELTETGTVLLSFDVIDEDPFRFTPGQFVAVDLVHPQLGYRRSPYCLYGGSEAERTFQLLVRIVREGPVSVFLGDLEVGDVVSFRGPSGHSMLPRERDTHLVLMCTGVGLGPCRCLLRRLAREDPGRRITLFWGLRLEEDVCLLDELLALERELVNFTWEISLSQPRGEWPPLQGRITETVPPLLERLDDKQFYLTSNGVMVAEMGAALREVGVPGSRIYEESFFDHRHRPSREAVQRIVQRFETDMTAEVRAFRTRYSSG